MKVVKLSIQVIGIIGDLQPSAIEELQNQNFDICDTNEMVARAYLELDENFAYQLWPEAKLREEMEMGGDWELEVRWIPDYLFDLQKRALTEAERTRFEALRALENFFINAETLWMRRALLNAIAENQTLFKLIKNVEYEYGIDPYVDDYREWLYNRGWRDGDVQKWINETNKFGKEDPFEPEIEEVEEYIDLEVSNSQIKISEDQYFEITGKKIAILNVRSEPEKSFIKKINGAVYEVGEIEQLPGGIIPELNGLELADLMVFIECGANTTKNISLSKIKAIEVGARPDMYAMFEIAKRERLEIFSYQRALIESIVVVATKIRNSLNFTDRVWFDFEIYPKLKKIPSAIDPAGFLMKILQNRRHQGQNKGFLLCDFENGNFRDSARCATVVSSSTEIHWTK